MKFEEVLKTIEQNNCKYISGEYYNNNSKLILKCKCGNIFEKDLNHFKRGQTCCKNCSIDKLKKSKTKYDLEKAKEILSEKGYTLLEKEYISSNNPMKCLCKNSHFVEIKLSHFLKNHSGCKICANNDMKGKNHWNYKGGECELIDFLRKSLKKWKKEVLKRDNYKCIISKSNKNLKIHHLINFSKIVEETLYELKLPLHRKLKDYKVEDLSKILDLFLKKHTLDLGVTITNELHKKFHNLYGLKNNTKEQFKEFCQLD